MSRYALLMGINRYSLVSGLQGCVNDCLNIKGILENYGGFSEKDITILADSQVTKENVLLHFKQISGKSIPGDHVVISFSGHGSQIPDTSGDETTDYKDEILCLYEMNWKNGSGYLIDDDLKTLAQAMKGGVFVEYILDSCHSGIAYSVVPRESHIVTVCREQNDMYETYGRYLPPPPEIVSILENLHHTRHITRSLLPLEEARDILSQTQALWSGCGEGQTSADAFIGGKYNGAFTYFWCEALSHASGNISRANTLKTIRANLSTGGYTQIPELMCSDLHAQKVVFN